MPCFYANITFWLSEEVASLHLRRNRYFLHKQKDVTKVSRDDSETIPRNHRTPGQLRRSVGPANRRPAS
jgi:hypothetical protein